MQPDRTDELVRLLRKRILVMDGAMGTMLQQCKLTPDDFAAASTITATTSRATTISSC